MFINVQFKNRQKQFTGKVYSYELCSDEITPKENDIIRLMDENYNWLFNGTRVKVKSCNNNSSDSDSNRGILIQKVRFVLSSMEEK